MGLQGLGCLGFKEALEPGVFNRVYGFPLCLQVALQRILQEYL